jgi:hypothetical protein
MARGVDEERGYHPSNSQDPRVHLPLSPTPNPQLRAFFLLGRNTAIPYFVKLFVYTGEATEVARR